MLVRGYSDFSLSRAGILTECVGPRLGAHFKLQDPVDCLFPYINTIIDQAKYHRGPERIQFPFEKVYCTLYPQEVLAAPFADRSAAVRFIARLFDFLNDLHARQDSLVPDYRQVGAPLSLVDLVPLLPMSNCKRCGYATCLAFAAALRTGKSRPGDCPDFAAPIARSVTYPILDNKGQLTSTLTLDIDDKPACKSMEATRAAVHPAEDGFSAESSPLTPREAQVLRLMAEGLTNTQISAALSISPHTVKSHTIHIFNKLSVNDRTQAAVWAARHGLV